jgi:hypothetical protein
MHSAHILCIFKINAKTALGTEQPSQIQGKEEVGFTWFSASFSEDYSTKSLINK